MLISSPDLLGSGGRVSNHHLDYIRAELARGLDCETRILNAELMNAFFVEIVNPANLLATVLLGGVLLYWLLVIFGAVGMDAFEIDLDLDADGDFDLEFADGLFGTMLTFFHVGKVPVMIIISVFAFTFWLATIFTNHYLNPEFSLWTTSMLVWPCGLVSLAVTKLVVMPLAKGFNPPPQDLGRTDLIGKTAAVNTLKLNQTYGEIVIEIDGPPLVLNARNETGQTLSKGDIVRIVSYDREKNVCLVELAKMEMN